MSGQDNEDIEKAYSEEFMALTQSGRREYKKMQSDSFKIFGIWFSTGLIGGGLMATCVNHLPIKNKSIANLNKWKAWSIIFGVTTFGYHGYKMARRDFFVGRKRLCENKEYCILVSKAEVEAQRAGGKI